jgi:hypothetical protein
VPDNYPPVKQFETGFIEAEQQRQLHLERRQALLRKVPAARPRWHARARAFALCLLRSERRAENVNQQASAEPVD